MKQYQQISKLILLLALLALSAQSVSAFYDSSLGRWINREPTEEADGANLYAFMQNKPIESIDAFGLRRVGWCCCVYTRVSLTECRERCKCFYLVGLRVVTYTTDNQS
jgi:hypothetical protein